MILAERKGREFENHPLKNASGLSLSEFNSVQQTEFIKCLLHGKRFFPRYLSSTFYAENIFFRIFNKFRKVLNKIIHSILEL